MSAGARAESPIERYRRLREAMVQPVPAGYRIAWWVCGRHAGDASRPALVVANGPEARRVYSFSDVWTASARLANSLRASGVGRGTRIAIAGPQAFETAVAHIATYRLGGVAVPLSPLFGPDAYAYRLADSGAACLLAWGPLLERLLEAMEGAALRPAVVWAEAPGALPDGVCRWDDVLGASSDDFEDEAADGETPCVLIYTSGTSGRPKGVLHAQRTIWAHVPAITLAQHVEPERGGRFWSPADWAWAGGLIDGLLAAWHLGLPVVTQRPGRFDPEAALALLDREAITSTFIPPTALRLMAELPPRPRAAALAGLMTGGEALGRETYEWARRAFGCPVNEVYGQTEMSCVLGNAACFPARPGSVGLPYPGATVEVLGPDGEAVATDALGEIAVRGDAPMMFLGYWRDAAATSAKFHGPWALSGDLGRRDADGYFWIHGRQDDVIISGGYRVSPTEVEECLARHPSVADAAVVGVPDAMRGQVLKAVVQRRPGVPRTEDLARAIQGFVRERLALYEYPRRVEFLDELPRTETGKVRRTALRQAEAARAGAAERNASDE